MKVQDVPIGYIFQHNLRGEGVIIKRTPKTLTAKFPKSTVKISYRSLTADFYPSDF